MLLTAFLATLGVLAHVQEAEAPPSESQGEAAVPTLVLGQERRDRIEDSAAGIHTATLDRDYGAAVVHGLAYSYTADAPGWLTLTLRSADFDAYLVLKDGGGDLLAEDDDGLEGSDARLVFLLKKGDSIQVEACALHGEFGAFQLLLDSGAEAGALREAQESLAQGLELKMAELFQHGSLDTALELATEVLALREEAYAVDHPLIGSSHGNLGTLLLELDRTEDALPHLHAAIDHVAMHQGEKHPDLLNPLYNLSVACFVLGRPEEEARCLERMIAVEGTLDADMQFLMVEALDDLATLRRAEGRFLLGLDLAMRAVELGGELAGVDPVDQAMRVYGYAEALHGLGRYAEAETVFREVHELLLAAHGKEDPQIGVVLNQIALNQGLSGDEPGAVKTFTRAIDLLVRSAGEDDLETAGTRSNFGAILVQLGEMDRALHQFEMSLSTVEGLLGPDHLECATLLNNIAFLYQSIGDVETAVPLLQRSLAITRSASGASHPDTATGLNNLGMMMVQQGAAQDALPLLEECLRMRLNMNGEEHPDTLQSHMNLGLALLDVGRIEAAGSHFKAAVQASSKLYGEAHAFSARARAGLGKWYWDQGRLPEAEIEMRASWSGLVDIHGEVHPLSLAAARNVGNCLLAQADFGAARDLLEGTLQSLVQLLGADHPDVVLTRISLADCLYSLGAFEHALPHYLAAHWATSGLFDRQFPTMSESARFQLLARWPDPEALVDCTFRASAPRRRASYAALLDWKGKVTRMQRATRVWSRQPGTTELQRKLDQVQQWNHQIQKHVLNPDAPESIEIEELRLRRLELEREINRQTGLDRILEAPDTHAVQQELSETTVLLDFLVGKEVYVWILKSQGEPLLLLLGETEALRKEQESLLRNRLALTRLGRGGRTTEAPTPAADRLRNFLWDPIAPHLADAERLLICPDGFLCELPFAVMQDEEGRFLLEKFSISYLADAARLAHLPAPMAQSEGSLCVVGDVNYFLREGGEDLVLVAADAVGRIHTRWNSLPGTRQELQALQDLLRYVLRWKTERVRLEGGAATEEAVKAAVVGKRYLHFATHAYFEPDHLPSLMADGAAKREAAQTTGEVRRAVGLLPGFLSGLVLAGANQIPAEGMEDGYLSAEEVGFLDLAACDLAVLSACETALGSSRAGNGLMSLRRAFDVAGARSVVSSLWKVDDRDSATLMRDFYTHLWELGQGKEEALRNAQLKMLQRNRESGGDPRPSSWGAFVLSGDWR